MREYIEDYVEAIVLGVVQGITEFLPISSDGHLVIAKSMLDRMFERPPAQDNMQMIVALHIGTLAAIVAVYHRDLLRLLKQPKSWTAIIVATIPVVIVGLTFQQQIEALSSSPLAAGIGLLVTAAFLFAATIFEREEQATGNVTVPKALFIGLCQTLAPLPGISRSGTTISAALLARIRRETATSFSFLIAVPAVAGAIVLKTKDAIEGNEPVGAAGPLLVGIALSFIVGWLALTWLIRLVSKNKLHWFAWYCVIVGMATIAWQLVA